ncbi:HI1506-related protein [Pseudoalteromonas piscicida]|uniref:HI1506-related protein n=1 Tax=Pseudoalteromonas piscicida TaxID=43662 RepID=UPI0030C8DF4B
METRLPSITVHNPRQQHYHRAGFKFESGKTELSAEQLSEDALAILRADPHIRVTENSPVEFASQGNGVDSQSVGDDLILDLSGAPEELAHIIAAIHALNAETPLTKPPKVADLACEVDGVEELVTPTAEQRDAAWAWYQENKPKVEAE